MLLITSHLQALTWGNICAFFLFSIFQFPLFCVGCAELFVFVIVKGEDVERRTEDRAMVRVETWCFGSYSCFVVFLIFTLLSLVEWAWKILCENETNEGLKVVLPTPNDTHPRQTCVTVVKVPGIDYWMKEIVWMIKYYIK